VRVVELAPPGPEVIITRLSSLEPLSLDWLWPGYIPAGMLAILDGDPGLGKSLLTLDLVARVTRGWAMPGQPPSLASKPRGGVVLSAEDDLARTILPRLIAAGADVHRVAVVALREHGTTREPVICLEDLSAVEQAIAEVDAAILVIDPLVAFLSDTVNANRDQDVRRSLSLLADLAERTGTAVVAVRHLRKSGADNPIYRGGGSIGIIGAAREGLLVARDPDDPTRERRIIAVTKSNLGPLPSSLAFTVVVAPGESHPNIAWQGETTHQAADLLATVDEDERGASDEAEDFLRELLAAGSVPAREVQREARAAGIAPRTLERAKGRLGVKSTRPDGFTGPWFWTLPEPYIANGRRTSPPVNVGDVRGDLAIYRPDEARAQDAGKAAAGSGAAEGTAPAWCCPADPGSGHVPAVRPDGALYCGTCHP
jgi:archaellum biogenesis ATPase FlaH